MGEHPPIFWESMAVFASPIVPAGVAAFRLAYRPGERNISSMLPLGVIFASLIYMLAGGLFPSVLGPYYSNLRYRLIGGNIAICLLAAILSATAKPSLQKWTLASALMLSAIWMFVGAINSVV
jgi:hypothetical protein